MLTPKIIEGNSSSDYRGTIRFVNDFNMNDVKRFYIIRNLDTNVIRAWRAHKIEQRWFYVAKGSFQIKAIKIDNWETPNKKSEQVSFELSNNNIQVLHIPVGYATSLRALEEDSELMVFADYGMEHAMMDNYLYPFDYFG